MYKIDISFMAQMRGLLCLIYTIVFLSIGGTANIGVAREADKQGAPTTGQASNKAKTLHKVKPEWKMPDYYPADGFDGIGYIDDISIRDGMVVINDMALKVSLYAEYHTPTTKNVSGYLFKVGDKVGYIKNSDNTIISMWLIVKK